MITQTSYGYIFDVTTGSWLPLTALGSNFPEPFTPSASVPLLAEVAFNLGFNGTAWEKIRVANVHKVARVTDSTNPDVVWAAVAAKKIRLMGFTLSVAGTQAAPEIIQLDLTFGSGGTLIWSGNVALQDTITADSQLGADFGQGILGPTNTGIFLSLSDDILTGDAAITLWGTEE